MADETPDGIVWKADNGELCRACAHCDSIVQHANKSESYVYRSLQVHLWTSHRIRRVWIDWFDYSTNAATQLAIPFVLEAQTRAELRRITNPRHGRR